MSLRTNVDLTQFMTIDDILLSIRILVGALTAGHVLLKKSDPVSCLGWLLGVALFPITTGLVYLTVGVNPFDAFAHKKRRTAFLTNPERAKIPPAELASLNKHALQAGGFSGFERTTAWVTNLLGEPLLKNGTIDAVINSNAVYQDFEAAIAQAKKYILVQFYQIQPDAVGFHFLDLLAARAEQGVAVYVLYDALGSYGLKEHVAKKYRERGLKISSFLPVHPIKRKFQVNWRNHRKLLIVDGELGFTGGFNIGSQYLQGKDLEHPAWLDVTFRLTGPIISVMEHIFAEDWHFTTGSSLSLPPKNTPPPVKEQSGLMAVIASGPSEEHLPFHSTLLSTIYEAREKLWLITPYFVPDKSLIQALRVAAWRGVDIRLLIPLRSNHPMSDFCTTSYFRELLPHHIKIYRYKCGVCHAKILLADDDLVICGSSNIDYRSFFLNFETDLFIRDKTFARQMAEFFEKTLQNSPLLGAQESRIRLLPTEMFRRMIRLIAPLL